jgi:excisionase family DNA binding protein
MEKRALSISEFCGRYGIGRTTTYEEIQSGRLRAVKVGRRTLVTESDAESWLATLTNVKAKPQERLSDMTSEKTPTSVDTAKTAAADHE